MKRILRMKCACGHWNRVPVNKVFLEQSPPEPKAKVMIPMYESLKVVKCKKCGKVIAEPKELIRIIKAKCKYEEWENLIHESDTLCQHYYL